MVCAAASRRDSRLAIQRSGWPTGSTEPRSGQVPTTTWQPAVRSRETASARCFTERAGGTRPVMSFAPIMMTHTSGTGARPGSVSSSDTCRSRSADPAPESATLCSSTGRSDTAASPEASSAPGVCPERRTPRPAAVESPSIASRHGGPAEAANAVP